jgi:hypothetical protein
VIKPADDQRMQTEIRLFRVSAVEKIETDASAFFWHFVTFSYFFICLFSSFNLKEVAYNLYMQYSILRSRSVTLLMDPIVLRH